MARYVAAALVFVALAAGVWWFLVSDTTPTTTTPVAAPSPTTTTPPSTSTSGSANTTTDSHVVESVEEAEGILRDLWFGWFEGIYNQDEDRIREVVATEEQVEVARGEFGVMEFRSRPTPTSITFSAMEVLRSDTGCLAVEATVVLSDFRIGESRVVHVVRWLGDRWVLLGLRASRTDIWETDCERSL